MSINIRKIGITDLDGDCIVNAADACLLKGGGVCGAIFREAGAWNMQRACDKYGYCPTGSAVITPGFKLRAKFVIHAVGPIWRGGSNGEEKQLHDCYQASMKLAEENGCRSIAFPVISSGIYGYPKEEAWKVALKSVSKYLRAHPDYDLEVTFAVLDDRMYDMGTKILDSLTKSN